MKDKGPEGKVEEKQNVCIHCGGALNGIGECTACGKKQNDAEAGNKEAVIKEFSELGGIGESKAVQLYDSGFKNLEDIEKASTSDLAKLEGISEKLAKAIRIDARKLRRSKGKIPGKHRESLSDWLKGSDDSFAVWLGGEGKGPAPKKLAGRPMAAPKKKKPGTPTSVLRRWLAGEEETLKSWLTEVEDDRKTAEGIDAGEKNKELMEALKMKEGEIDALKLEMEELKKALNLDLKHLKREEFDAVKLVADSARLKAQVQTETSRRKRLEEEIKQVKKGSIAIIKYTKAQQLQARRKAGKMDPALQKKLALELKSKHDLLTKLKAYIKDKLEKGAPEEKTLKELELKLAERESALKAKEDELKVMEDSIQSGEATRGEVHGANEELYSKLQAELADKDKNFMERENEFKNKIIELEKELQKTKIEFKQQEESLELRGKSAPEIESDMANKVRELQMKEKSILLREEEIQRLKDELHFKEDEIKKIKEPLMFKEEEMLRREEDLLYRERKMSSEKRKMEEDRAKLGGTEELELKERLETLKIEVQRKEEEVRNKEKYLKAKMEELRLREQGLIEEDIEQREEERKLELTQEKVKTGTSRLDDLLLGGFPFGSNVAVYGPPFVGKEVLMNGFMAEAVKKGVPIIWVLTDKMSSDIREEMKFIAPSYEEYERMGLVKYIDSYSKSMGIEDLEDDPYTTYVDDPTDHDAILKAVDDAGKVFKEKHEYYRLGFRSVSTLIAYLDPTNTYRLLQAFSGKRKRDKAVTMYSIEKGMHSDQEIQMIGSVMDGMIEFKLEQLNTLFSVKGICDVQSRAWIRYTHSKQGITVGSFSLEAIR